MKATIERGKLLVIGDFRSGKQISKIKRSEALMKMLNEKTFTHRSTDIDTTQLNLPTLMLLWIH